MNNNSNNNLRKQILLPSIAGSTAVLFTHPLDLTKIRLQLDNEMALKGSKRSYNGILHCLYHNWETAGIRGLQRGLSYGIMREFFFNGARIGCYEPILHQYQKLKHNQTLSNYERFFIGQIVGAFAGAFVNPIEVLKVRNQALGGLTGYQHKIQNIFSASLSLVKEEGFRGFFRGIEVQILRGFLGAGTQLPTYTILKEKMSEYGYQKESIFTHIFCSAISAGVSILFCNPADVIRTRIYNQPFDPVTGKGLLYKNGFDAFLKIFKTEGFAGFYKGGWTHYSRLGPHIILVFVFLEQMKNWTI